LYIGRNDGKILSETYSLKEGRVKCRKHYILQIRTETSGIVIALILFIVRGKGCASAASWWLMGLCQWEFFLDCLNLEDGTDNLSRNVSNYQNTQHNFPEERRSFLHRVGSLKSQIV